MTKKSLLAALALGAAGALALAGCSSPAPSPSTAPSEDAGSESYRIGISQLAQHPALDAIATGFQKAFTDAGVEAEFDLQNASAEQANATTIANKFKSDKVDLVLAIATISAQTAAQAISDIPIVFAGVTDPVDAGLVESWEAPGSNVTGTSDLNPVEEQLKLIKDVQPDAKSIGIIYSSGEPNSQVQVDMAKAASEKLGLEIKESAIADSRDIAQAAEGLGDIDAIYVPTDNKIVEALESVIQFGESKKVPIYGTEDSQVERGSVASYGINYEKMGELSGRMALDILQKGEKPATMPVQTLTDLTLVINPAAAERMGLTFSEAIIARAERSVE